MYGIAGKRREQVYNSGGLQPARSKRQDARGWDNIFRERQAQLVFAARMILHCPGNYEAVLTQAQLQLRELVVSENFGPDLAMRIVVKAAIAHNFKETQSEVVDAPRDQDRVSEGRETEGLPWLERAVHFLRNTLRYSRRDTALLLHLDDLQVDRLLQFAEKRVALDKSLVTLEAGR